MADGYIDRLIYALDGDVGPFKAKAAQIDAEAGKIAEGVKSKTKDMFAPATDSAKALEQEIDRLKKKISPGLWTDSDVAKLKAASRRARHAGQ